MEKLHRLARKLAKTYRWREGDALWFVLTGSTPEVSPLRAVVSVSESVQDYHPNTVRIVLESDVWVDAKEIERTYRDIQQQILGHPNRPLAERTLEVVAFVTHRMRERSKESWRQRWDAWNKTYPTEWQYDDFRGLRQAFHRFINQIINREYNHPKWKAHEPSPYLKWSRKRWRQSDVKKLIRRNYPSR